MLKTMKRKSLYLAAVALLATTACSDKMSESTLQPQQNKDYIVTEMCLEVSSEDDAKSRATITDKKFAWSEADQIALFNTLNRNTKLTFQTFSEAGTHQAEFKGQVKQPTNDETKDYWWAVYPYSEVDLSTNDETDAEFPWKYQFSMPTVQTVNYIDGKLDPASIGEYIRMVGRTTGQYSRTMRPILTLNHVTTYIDLKLENITADEKVNKVTITTNDEQGFATQSLADVACWNQLDTMKIIGQSYEKTLTLNLTENGAEGVKGATDGTLIVRVALLPTQLKDFTQWNIKVEKTSGKTNSDYVKKFFSNVTIESGKLYTMESGVKIGALWRDDATQVKGVICYIAPDGKTGKVLSLDEKKCVWATAPYDGIDHWIEAMGFAPDVPEKCDKQPFIDDKGWDGKGKTKAIKDYCQVNGIDFKTAFPAAAWCDGHNAEGVDAWYMPDTSELLEYIIGNGGKTMSSKINPILIAMNKTDKNVVPLVDDPYWVCAQRGYRSGANKGKTPSNCANAIRMGGKGGFRALGGDQFACPKTGNWRVRAMADVSFE